MSKVGILATDKDKKHAGLYGTPAGQVETLLVEAGYEGDFLVFDAMESEFPDDEQLKDIKSIWITGSGADSFADVPWILNLMTFIQKVISNHEKISIVGICFGHQVIARALGSKVNRNPKGWELGSYKVALNQDEEIKKLFEGTDTFRVLEVHQDVVFEIPEGYKNLGSTETTEFQGFYKENKMLTFQGHPEFVEGLVEQLTRDVENIDDAEKEKFIGSLKSGHDGKGLLSKIILRFIEA